MTDWEKRARLTDFERPGSQEAINLGCRCPRMDNHNGKGRGGNGEKWGWYITENCPLHGTPAAIRASAPKGE